jgi:Uma2 family endonuclease
MTMPVTSRRLTVQEYFAFEETARDRHEFHDGEIRMMSGGTYSQALINANLISLLRTKLSGTPCRPIDSNLRHRVGSRSNYVYPDVSVIRGPPAFDPNDSKQTTVLNPKVVFETLSDSTESYDRGEKFLMYRDVDSLDEYVLITQHVARVETFTRLPDGLWRIERAVEGIDRSVRIASLGIELLLTEIYRDVMFPAGNSPSPATPS